MADIRTTNLQPGVQTPQSYNNPSHPAPSQTRQPPPARPYNPPNPEARQGGTGYHSQNKPQYNMPQPQRGVQNQAYTGTSQQQPYTKPSRPSQGPQYQSTPTSGYTHGQNLNNSYQNPSSNVSSSTPRSPDQAELRPVSNGGAPRNGQLPSTHNSNARIMNRPLSNGSTSYQENQNDTSFESNGSRRSGAPLDPKDDDDEPTTFLGQILHMLDTEFTFRNAYPASLNVWISTWILPFSLVLYVTAFITVGWAETFSTMSGTDVTRLFGLWQLCHSVSGCSAIKGKDVGGGYHAAQAFAVLSLLSLLAAIVLFILYIFFPVAQRMPQVSFAALGSRVSAVLCLLLTFAIYSDNWYKPNFIAPDYERKLSYSHSLCIVTFVLELFATLFMALEVYNKQHERVPLTSLSQLEVLASKQAADDIKRDEMRRKILNSSTGSEEQAGWGEYGGTASGNGWGEMPDRQPQAQQSGWGEMPDKRSSSGQGWGEMPDKKRGHSQGQGWGEMPDRPRRSTGQSSQVHRQSAYSNDSYERDSDAFDTSASSVPNESAVQRPPQKGRMHERKKAQSSNGNVSSSNGVQYNASARPGMQTSGAYGYKAPMPTHYKNSGQAGQINSPNATSI